jgi:hypothetical protein
VPDFHLLAPACSLSPRKPLKPISKKTHLEASALRGAWLLFWSLRALAAAALVVSIVLLAWWVRSNTPIRQFLETFSLLLWTVNFNQPLIAIPREYSIVAQFHNSDTSQLTLIAADVGANGEVAA